MKTIKKGFTLIELLIVIAIIGILAGVILVSTSSSTSNAMAASGKQTMRSTLTHMVLCKAQGGALSASYTANGNICQDATLTDAKWPAMPTGCSLFAVAGNRYFNGTCGASNIVCDAFSGSCF